MKGVRSFLCATALAFTAMILLSSPVYAASPSWAWGGFTATNFTTNEVVGMRANVWPYWQHPPGWTGWTAPDKSVVFPMTVFTPYSESFNGIGLPAFQIALLTAHASPATPLMYIIVELPGDSAFRVICGLCVDGTVSHTYEISRTSSGWNLYLDGSLEREVTCSCTNDVVDLNRNQEPYAMEVSTGLQQSDIDNNIVTSQAQAFNYEASPVGSGTWPSIPHMYAYYYNTGNCTNTQVGDTIPPNWAAANANGPFQTVETATITNLSRILCGQQFFSPPP